MFTMLRAAARFLGAAAAAFLLTSNAWSAGSSDGFINLIAGKQPSTASAPSITPKIITSTEQIAAGRTTTVALQLQHATGWHSYGPFSGDTGYATKAQWQLPQGWSIQPMGWPLPEKLATGSLLDYVYSGTVTLPYRLTVPESEPVGGTQKITLDVSWLACKDVCVPGHGSAELFVTVGENSQPTEQSSTIKDAIAALPTAAKPGMFSATAEGHRLRLDLNQEAGTVAKSLYFYPEGKKQIDVHVEQAAALSSHKNSLFLSLSSLSSPIGSWQLTGVIAADGGPQQGGWAKQISIPITAGTVGAAPVHVQQTQDEPSLTGVAAIVFAFLGGLILNLMPCVFPVLSLKILQLVEGKNRKGALAIHGFAFTGGVLVSMLILSGALLALRAVGCAVGWGFQLQSPWVVAVLALLFFVLALNVGGLFEVTAGSSIANTKTVQSLTGEGPAGSFWTGVLAVIVASPCTAPFMGAAMGYAITQPVVESLLVFVALGLGMAAPWLLLTLMPFWVKWLPRPGAWMLWFKRIVALPLVGAYFWLAWVLSQQVCWWGLVALAAASLFVALFYWTIGRAQHGKRSLWPIRVVSFVAAALCLLVIAMGKVTVATHNVESGWQSWSPTLQEQELAKGRPVFIDFTAAWCVTCQYNKKAVLTTAQAQKLFAAADVALFVADWTNQDATISKELEKFGRTGVPLYVLYDGRGQVQVLPQLLTLKDLEQALEKLPQQ